MSEEWRPIPGHPGYEASSLGQIRSRWIVGGAHNRGRRLGPQWRIVRGSVNVYGYRQLAVLSETGSRSITAHILIAEAFHGPRPEEGWEVRHLNGVKLDLRAENLQWGTRTEQRLDDVRHGRHPNARKTHCKRGHPFDGANTYILPGSGSRACRACIRARQAASSGIAPAQESLRHQRPA